MLLKQLNKFTNSARKYRSGQSGRSLLNTAANLSGRVLCGLASIIAAPLVVGILGQEAYGIVSFALAIQALVAVFDLGLAATVKRELAGSVAQERPIGERTSILRTFELAYWAAAVVVGGVLLYIAPLLAHGWLKLTTTSPA